MEINITDYLSKEEIKDIAKEEVKKYVREVIGSTSDTQHNKEWSFVNKLAKNLAKEGCQKLIPNFEQLINEHIQSEIKTIKLETLFWESIGWRSPGNKIINKVLAANEHLIEAKVKELFKPKEYETKQST